MINKDIQNDGMNDLNKLIIYKINHHAIQMQIYNLSWLLWHCFLLLREERVSWREQASVRISSYGSPKQ